MSENEEPDKAKEDGPNTKPADKPTINAFEQAAREAAREAAEIEASGELVIDPEKAVGLVTRGDLYLLLSPVRSLLLEIEEALSEIEQEQIAAEEKASKSTDHLVMRRTAKRRNLKEKLVQFNGRLNDFMGVKGLDLHERMTLSLGSNFGITAEMNVPNYHRTELPTMTGQMLSSGIGPSLQDIWAGRLHEVETDPETEEGGN